MSDALSVKCYLDELQDRICASIESRDTAKFKRDPWVRTEGGGGETRVLSEGAFLSAPAYPSRTCLARNCRRPPQTFDRRSSAPRFRQWDCRWCCIRAIPMYPPPMQTYASSRPRQTDAATVWWFGGGFDLTPYYPYEEDVLHWHRTASDACQPFGVDLYAKYKEWCDRYFYLPHRDETRGVGGLFFDDLSEGGFAACFAFLKSVGDHFLPAYLPILDRRKDQAYGERERQFQLYRRGRYVEFNLVQDRGTAFGLQSRGRTESILMSLPPLARWEYDWKPEAGSPEARLYEDFLRPRDYLTELG